MMALDNPFLARLRAQTGLSSEEVAALRDIAADPSIVISGRTLVTEGDPPRRLHILLEGWAARVKWLPDGRRHLCAIVLPGDICDVDGLHLRAYDYGVVALTACTIMTIDLPVLLALLDERSRVARALTWLAFVDNAILNEASVSLGRRSARERLAHFYCEIMLRLKAIGRSYDDGYRLPLTQETVGDALGLTAVHVNRTLRTLIEDGLLAIRERQVHVPEWKALQRAASFSPAYLHLDGMRRASA